ncbi:hypothetical protein ABE137_20410 [Brevibacillus laterosporus]|uniref:Uncharacterized protein n=2 Tax=Brevibacillus TaxID=55080 RepID=A0A0F6Y0L3_BRELA|nr:MULTISPECIES: hypothetical protein [Brevibacillus]AKF95726.1 hypothetical protein EX87_19015 [Brevibacillus laterosporus]MCR8985568.1 hypothetical protein [Brevibacillus laterosporus]MCZ0831302.1 hypothetical protein [Brevibacillus halotolerans]MDN9011632.1 hypothetical protein [Brevibacillus laterosporus]MDO0942632.1 hypothetical protein [Brevibacillus laterosporus]
MKKSTAKRILRDYPEFEAWLKQKPTRVARVLSNPATMDKYLEQWEKEKKRQQRTSLASLVNLQSISEKTRKVNEKLTSLQSILDVISDNKKI